MISSRRNNKQKNIDYLLEFCSDYPEEYNKISNELYIQFNIRSAELSLLCTYISVKMRNK